MGGAVKKGGLIFLVHGRYQSVMGQSRALVRPMGVGLIIKIFFLLIQRSKEVHIVYALCFQQGNEALQIALSLQRLPHVGKLLRVEGGLVRGDGEVEPRPLGGGVFTEKGQSVGGRKS